MSCASLTKDQPPRLAVRGKSISSKSLDTTDQSVNDGTSSNNNGDATNPARGSVHTQPGGLRRGGGGSNRRRSKLAPARESTELGRISFSKVVLRSSIRTTTTATSTSSHSSEMGSQNRRRSRFAPKRESSLNRAINEEQDDEDIMVAAAAARKLFNVQVDSEDEEENGNVGQFPKSFPLRRATLLMEDGTEVSDYGDYDEDELEISEVKSDNKECAKMGGSDFVNDAAVPRSRHSDGPPLLPRRGTLIIEDMDSIYDNLLDGEDGAENAKEGRTPRGNGKYRATILFEDFHASSISEVTEQAGEPILTGSGFGDTSFQRPTSNGGDAPKRPSRRSTATIFLGEDAMSEILDGHLEEEGEEISKAERSFNTASLPPSKPARRVTLVLKESGVEDTGDSRKDDMYFC